MPSRENLDMDAIIACTDLVGRSGAKDLELGYVHDDVPVDEAGWYATATYRGAKIIVDDQRSQDAACDALARRILDGGHCAHCGQLVTLNDDLPGCRWRRMGARWERGCEDPKARPTTGPNRAARRAHKKRGRP